MGRAPRQALRHQGGTNNGTLIIIYFHQIVHLNAALGSIVGINPDDPIVKAVDFNPVVFDVVDERIFAVTLSVKGIANSFQTN